MGRKKEIIITAGKTAEKDQRQFSFDLYCILSFFLSFGYEIIEAFKNLVFDCDRAFIVLNNCYDLSQEKKLIQKSFSSCKQVDIYFSSSIVIIFLLLLV